MGNGNKRNQDGEVERGSNERDNLIDRAIMGLGRNLVLGKFPGIHMDDPS